MSVAITKTPLNFGYPHGSTDIDIEFPSFIISKIQEDSKK